MCGIVGAAAKQDIVPVLIDGLKRLEYRGYDSAGIAVLDQRTIERIRSVGKVATLADKVHKAHLTGHIGIAHTRWATHGAPTEANAHPHMAAHNVAVVHNGIIENFAELKAALLKNGVVFASDTDTEVIVHLIDAALKQSNDLYSAVKSVIPQLKGAYALVVMAKSQPDMLIAVRKGSPLVLGLGKGENFIASDCLS